jgi:hypothetical protein
MALTRTQRREQRLFTNGNKSRTVLYNASVGLYKKRCYKCYILTGDALDWSEPIIVYLRALARSLFAAGDISRSILYKASGGMQDKCCCKFRGSCIAPNACCCCCS